MSSNNNNNQFPSQFGQNTTSDQNQQFNTLPGATGTSFNAPSGTHAQQHNLHSLDTPLDPPGTTGSGTGYNLEQEARKLQSDIERNHPHQQTGGHSSNPFTQNQGQLHQNHGTGPLSSQPAAHNTTGGAVLTGVGAGVTGLPTGGNNSDPYTTNTIGSTGNHGHPTTLPGTGMSIGGQQQYNQGSTLPVSGSVLDHSKDNRHQYDQSKSEQAGVDRDRAARQLASGQHGDHTTGTGLNQGTTAFNDNNNDIFPSQGQHHKGPLEADLGVAGAAGTHGTNNTGTHGTTHTGTHGNTNTGTHGTTHTGTHGTGAHGTHGTGAHGTDFDSSNRHKTTGGLTSTGGHKDGDRLAKDTHATNAGHGAAHNATSDPAGHKPTMGDKIAGKVEKIQGKITGNPDLVAKGEQREQGFAPKN